MGLRYNVTDKTFCNPVQVAVAEALHLWLIQNGAIVSSELARSSARLSGFGTLCGLGFHKGCAQVQAAEMITACGPGHCLEFGKCPDGIIIIMHHAPPVCLVSACIW